MNTLLALLAPLGGIWLLCSAIVAAVTALDALSGVRDIGWRFALVLIAFAPLTLVATAYLAWTDRN